MKICIILLAISFSTCPALASFLTIKPVMSQSEDTAIVLPLAGNTWVEGKSDDQKLITGDGVKNWCDEHASFASYLRVRKPGTLHVRLRARSGKGSRLRLSINGKQNELEIKDDAAGIYDAGAWQIADTGYVKIVLSGISKPGQCFADISDYEIDGSAIDAGTAYVKNNEGNFYYWGRRGPSVHLNYPFADSTRAEWFYNEVTVPEGQDIIGSYYMATGFAEGYFGIQVNSATERRILFSVWSPFKTDDPKTIPPEKRIILLGKGEKVHTGEFGNEGSGGQSYLRYNWKAGTTYRFLLHGKPDMQGNTIYTAYFFAPEQNEWQLIASFRRPETNTYLKRFHSFLENFSPDQGDKQRRVLFGNQWIIDAGGKWTELTRAGFTYDNTAIRGYRMDYAGGIENGQFFLKNCGFFNEYTPYKSLFQRPPTNVQPKIDLHLLP